MPPSSYSNGTSNRPYVIQGTQEPVFRGSPFIKRSFVCTDCGHIFIEHYAEEDFIAFGIQCFMCNKISWTPCLPLGEVFSAVIVSLGTVGSSMIKTTVNCHSGRAIITCDVEIARELEATSPREDTTPLSLTEEGLNTLTQQYDAIVGGKFVQQRRLVNKMGDECARTFPYAWAVAHIEDALKNNILDIDRIDTATALMWLIMFKNVCNTWNHHPRFQSVARGMGMPKSFLHTCSQLITAAYIRRAGNRIGLSLENRHGEPNPDLYIRKCFDNGANLFIEVKAPEALQWSRKNYIPFDLIHKSVKLTIKRSKNQINRSHHGVLVISSSILHQDMSGYLERSIVSALKSKGRDHSSLAAVVGLSPENFYIDNTYNNNDINVSFRFTVTINEHYAGNNPIKTNSSIISP